VANRHDQQGPREGCRKAVVEWGRIKPKRGGTLYEITGVGVSWILGGVTLIRSPPAEKPPPPNIIIN